LNDTIYLERPLVPNTLTAEYGDSDGIRTLSPLEVEWASEDTTVAIVNNGEVRGIRRGRTAITASFAGHTAEMAVLSEDPERDILERFYHATDGDNWTNNDGWLSDRPYWASPGWYGVTAVGFEFPEDVFVPSPSQLVRKHLTSHVGIDTVPQMAAALDRLDAAWGQADPDSLAAAVLGRVIGLDLGDNNLSGRIPSTFRLPELFTLNLRNNKLRGEFKSTFLPSLLALSVGNNQFSGPLPIPRETPNMLIFSISHNSFSGSIWPDLYPLLLVMDIKYNELTGAMPDLVEANKRGLSIAEWYGNDGLCHSDSPEIRALLGGGLFSLFAGPICGLGLDDRRRLYLNTQNLRTTYDAASDSSEIIFDLLDGYGQRVPGGRDSVIWVSSAEAVATVRRHGDRVYIRTEGTGLARISVAEPVVTNPVTILVQVNQIPVSLDVPDISVARDGAGSWRAIITDRNGAEVRLPFGARAWTADRRVAIAYRNGVLEPRRVGSTDLTVTLPGGLTGSGTVTVTAGSRRGAARIDSIRPADLVPGQVATIHGLRLEAATVLIDGRAAVVESQSARELRFVVPMDPRCFPSRGVAVTVENPNAGAIATTRLQGSGESITLATGETEIVTLPAGDSVCVQLESDGEYFVMVQAVPDPGSVVDEEQLGAGFVVRTKGSEDDQLAGARVADYRPPDLGAPNDRPQRDLMTRHRNAEAALRERQRESLRSMAADRRLAAAAAPRTPVITRSTAVGDTVKLVSDLGECEITPENTIRGVVRAVGTYAVVVADLANAADYTTTQYQELSTSLEKIIPALTNYFGDFTDVNGDDRVTAVFSDKVGAAASGLLGYVSPLNLFPKTDCAASDEMEIFFGRTPDASLPYDELAPILPPLLAHELTHVIQGRRVDLTATDFDGAFAGYMERWLAEGQAQLGQEVAGYALGGRGPGNNYGAAVARGGQNGA